MILLGGQVRVADGYVFVCNDAVPDVATGRKILAAVDLALERGGVRSVLFDTREMPAPPEEVNELLRTWVDRCKYHDKVALLVKSDMRRVASNMRALAVRVKQRSFHDLAEAEAWLRAPIPVVRERTRPITEPLEQALPEPSKREATAPVPASTSAAPAAAATQTPPTGKKRERGQPPEDKPSDDTQPRFVWKSALLREYLGD